MRAPRQPVQERARQRREALLDAAARLLDRDGSDALTTTAVAKEAGASVGAVYDYFPRREALLAGLLDRYEAALADALDRALADPSDPLAAADAAVDALADLWIREPGYRAAWLGIRLRGEADPGDRWAARFTDRLERALAGIAPDRSPEELATIAFVCVHLVSGLLLAVILGPRERWDERIAEVRLALRAYVTARLTR